MQVTPEQTLYLQYDCGILKHTYTLSSPWLLLMHFPVMVLRLYGLCRRLITCVWFSHGAMTILIDP